MKVFFYSLKAYEQPFIQQFSDNGLSVGYSTDALRSGTVPLSSGYDAIVVFTKDDASADVVEKLHEQGIKYIATRSAGYDHIDLAACKTHGIKVANVPQYSPEAIAEHTVALMLALSRQLILADQRVRQYNFMLSPLMGFNLHKKTVGVIGTGFIGAALIRILHGFGCKILANDLVANEALQAECGVKYTSLSDIYAQCDIISLHLPLNEQTRYMLDAQSFKQMKKGVMIINTGRGGLLHTADAIEALKTEQIGYLGLDVYENEKHLFFEDHSANPPHDTLFKELLEQKNVLVTPHQAFLTD